MACLSGYHKVVVTDSNASEQATASGAAGAAGAAGAGPASSAAIVPVEGGGETKFDEPTSGRAAKEDKGDRDIQEVLLDEVRSLKHH
jgi:hypothetical protein